jgi:hypothetical protein
LNPPVLRRVPSADWRTENLEERWTQIPAQEQFSWIGSFHKFMDYCRLLRVLREQLRQDLADSSFDGYAFFLRGGYFAFKYLNQTDTLPRRATIFGGLNHAVRPKEELPVWLDELFKDAEERGTTDLRLAIFDEVKSGTGLGTALRVVKNKLTSSAKSLQVAIKFYAIRPGPHSEILGKLRATEEKWSRTHRAGEGSLSISITNFDGHLLSYDDDILCGVKRTNHNSAPRETYELVKLSGGDVTFICEETGLEILTALLTENACLVESLSAWAVALTTQPMSAVTANFWRASQHYGCPQCISLVRSASPRDNGINDSDVSDISPQTASN